MYEAESLHAIYEPLVSVVTRSIGGSSGAGAAAVRFIVIHVWYALGRGLASGGLVASAVLTNSGHVSSVLDGPCLTLGSVAATYSG